MPSRRGNDIALLSQLADLRVGDPIPQGFPELHLGALARVQLERPTFADIRKLALEEGDLIVVTLPPGAVVSEELSLAFMKHISPARGMLLEHGADVQAVRRVG
jgi:hypothetical protein